PSCQTKAEASGSRPAAASSSRAKFCLTGSAPASAGCRKARRMLKEVQMRGGAREPHARRTPCTLSVRPRAATKQMGLFPQPADRASRSTPGPQHEQDRLDYRVKQIDRSDLAL